MESDFFSVLSDLGFICGCLFIIAFPIFVFVYAGIMKKKHKGNMAEVVERLAASGFQTSRTIQLEEHFAVKVDLPHKKMAFINAKTKTLEVRNFDELIGVEVLEDNHLIKKGSVGNTIAAGVLFGTPGVLIADGLRKRQNYTKHMAIKVYTKNVSRPTITFSIINYRLNTKASRGLSKSSTYYRKVTEFAQEIYEVITSISG